MQLRALDPDFSSRVPRELGIRQLLTRRQPTEHFLDMVCPVHQDRKAYATELDETPIAPSIHTYIHLDDRDWGTSGRNGCVEKLCDIGCDQDLERECSKGWNSFHYRSYG